MTTPRFRCQWYQDIFEKFPNIVADAERAGKALKLDKVAGRVGLYTGASSVPGPLPDYVIDAIVAANRTPILPLKRVEDELRMLIKEVYGDAYDGAVTNTCEAGLRVAYETLFAPPFMRRGDAYRSRVLTPYGEDYEWGAAYGRAFPPRYKNIAVDRSVSAGELGMEAKSLANVDTLFVRYAGVPYEVHGIRQSVVPLMLGNDIDGTMARIREASARHAANLVGFQTIGYDTPGYGNGAHDDNGAPIFLKELGAFAASCDLPFLIDSASCLPVVGYSPVDVNADVMVYSMDKPGRAPIAGLMIGKAEAMSYIRKALGLGGDRAGGVSSHGKAAQSAVDPGRDSLVGLTTFLKVLRDDPGRITRPIDQYHEIIVEAFAEMKPEPLPRQDHHREVVPHGRPRAELPADLGWRRLRHSDLHRRGPLCQHQSYHAGDRGHGYRSRHNLQLQHAADAGARHPRRRRRAKRRVRDPGGEGARQIGRDRLRVRRSRRLTAPTTPHRTGDAP